MRRPMIAGNWKMNCTVDEALALVRGMIPLVRDFSKCDVVAAPPFTSLYSVSEELKGSNIALAAQNMHWEDSGAFTGEISAKMLTELGVSYVILGHSERRQYFGETDEGVSKKAAKALSAGLIPIICVGELLEQRENGEAFAVVEKQVRGAFEHVSLNEGNADDEVIIAYEPVWAIGTGKTATAEQAQEMHKKIRAVLAALHGRDRADATRILYGGSVKPENTAELMAGADVDGALVGGASLVAEKLASIVRSAV